MRVTNNMILKNSSYNIGSTKSTVNSTMNQMTTQKKISRPSEDPVTAIRSLRLSTQSSRIDQYYEKNIPDAESWLDVTETALTNMKTLMTDIRTQCVTGSTDTLTQDDRNTILSQLKSLQEQVYSEGNSDYAGRTVFTGYRTNKELVFSSDEESTSYEIEQQFDYSSLETYRYYSGSVTLPTTANEITNNDIADVTETEYYRLRLAYDEITEMDDATGLTINGTPQAVTVYDTEDDWMTAAGGEKTVGDDKVIFIKDTGTFVFGSDIATDILNNKYDISVDYTKTGFSNGELRPEYYFNCTDISNPLALVSYEKYDEDGNEITYDINYTVAQDQELTVNTEASSAFNSDIQRDIDDMLTVVERAIAAHDKVTTLTNMKSESQYSDDDMQTKLDEWITAAQKEADYADDDLQKLFSTEITKVDGYLSKVSLAITQVGCTADQLELTETRMSNQQETIAELQSNNDDVDISEIIINYTSAYNAYQASLTAAGKLSGQTLLNYI